MIVWRWNRGQNPINRPALHWEWTHNRSTCVSSTAQLHSGDFPDAFIQSDVQPFIHTFTHRRRCRPRRATASSSGRGALLRDTSTIELGAGDQTSNLQVTSPLSPGVSVEVHGEPEPALRDPPVRSRVRGSGAVSHIRVRRVTTTLGALGSERGTETSHTSDQKGFIIV